MFKAVVNGNLLQKTIAAYAVLIDEATFNITPDGVSLRVMDPNRVAMVDAELPSGFFDGGYTCTSPQKLTVNLTELLKLLKRADKDESIELCLPDGSEKLVVAIRGRYSRSFNILILDVADEDCPAPKLSFNVKAKIATAGLQRVLEDAQLVSDHVKIEVTEDGLTLTAVGDLMSANIELAKGSDTLLDLEVKAPAKATYSLSYITEIVKSASAISDIATLELSTDIPVRADFASASNVPGKLAFYLAPRIIIEE